MVEVLVLGGGVGGLSAAHELTERGFDVTVVEKRERFGGKARSFPGPETDEGVPLPAEHGFRFFPGFYQHVTDTMARIPYGEGTVKDNLVQTQEMMQATDTRIWWTPTAPDTMGDHREMWTELLGGSEVPVDETMYFFNRLTHLMFTSDQRWEEEYDDVNWWEFIDADRMSERYQTVLGHGVSQSLVAMQPERASTRTIGRIYLQLTLGVITDTMEADYVLNGPTSEVWIDPWVAYLDGQGADLRSSAEVTAIDSDGEAVTGVQVRENGEKRTVEADYYVMALPMEVLETLLTPELEQAAPSLSGIRNLESAWMNGIQFYLKEDVPMVDGHGLLYDSNWALTTVSHQQFWSEHDLAERTENTVNGVLSVCISDWNTPGIVHDKPAKECTPEQIREEVLAQLKQHLNHDDQLLTEDNIYDWYLDPAIQYNPEHGKAQNDEPLFINTSGSFKNRPKAATDAENLVVATDYTRTNTELASMECANEAARRATNAILKRSGSNAQPCTVEDLTLPTPIDTVRQADGILHRLNLPHPGDIVPTLWYIYSTIKTRIRSAVHVPLQKFS